MAEVRELLGPEHADRPVHATAPTQVDARPIPARSDYIGVGPVHATPTKPGRPAVGLELVRYAAAHATVPFFAIGGIDTHNIGEVVVAGARRVCVVRAIGEAADPERAAHQLRESIDAHSLEA